jgi:hypothetical protein
MSLDKHVTPALFVQLYMESHAQGHTMKQLAERLGWQYRVVYARAYLYTKRGVKLPKLAGIRRSGSPIDVSALNAIVGQYKQRPARTNGRVIGVGRRRRKQLAK